MDTEKKDVKVAAPVAAPAAAPAPAAKAEKKPAAKKAAAKKPAAKKVAAKKPAAKKVAKPSLPESAVITMQTMMKSQDRVRFKKYNLSVNPRFLNMIKRS